MGWRYTGAAPGTPLQSQVFLPEEVWFEKLPNPFDFWRGMPPLYAADTPARTDFAASQFMRGIIENNADAGLIVRTQADDSLIDVRRRPAALASGAQIISAQDESFVLPDGRPSRCDPLLVAPGRCRPTDVERGPAARKSL